MTVTTTAPRQRADAAGDSVAHRVLRFLRDLGCDRLFTVPGEAFLPLLDAADDDGFPIVTARHEAGAAFAALADARLTGRPAVVAVNRSPGATNASIALDAAKADPTPLLLVVGGADRGTDPVLGFQGTDIAALLGGVVPVVTLDGPDTLPDALLRIRQALGTAVPGPAVLVVPEDLWDLPADPVAIASLDVPDVPGDQAARRVREALAGARRPVVVAGRLLRRGDAVPVADLLDRFARGAGVPVVLGNKQQDLMDNRHPHYAGHLHLGSPAATKARLAEADLVVFLGDQPDEVHLSGWYADGRSLLTVHPRPLGPGERLAADPAAVLALLADTPGDAGGDGDRQEWVAGWRGLENDLSRPQPRPREDGLDFAQVAAVLNRRLPDDAIVTLDAGNFSSWVHRFVTLNGGQRLLALAGGSMGFGVPAAVAAATRFPDRTVVCVVGDGGVLMTGNELATGRALGRCPVVIVADNASYGTIRAHAARRAAADTCGTELSNPDLARWARSFGIPAERVAEPHHVEPAVRRALASTSGYLLHVHTSLTAVHANFDLR